MPLPEYHSGELYCHIYLFRPIRVVVYIVFFGTSIVKLLCRLLEKGLFTIFLLSIDSSIDLSILLKVDEMRLWARQYVGTVLVVRFSHK